MKGFTQENNDFFCSCSTDDTIKIWRAIQGVCLYSVNSHPNGVCSLAFLNNTAEDNFYIVSGGTNVQKTVKVWKIMLTSNQTLTAEFLNELDVAHEDSIRFLNFITFNNKRLLVSTSWDNNINIIEFNKL
jgi:WD40 repeat protein